MTFQLVLHHRPVSKLWEAHLCRSEVGHPRVGDAELGSEIPPILPKTVFAAHPAAIRWQQPASPPKLGHLQEGFLGFSHPCAIFQPLKPLLAPCAPPLADAASCPSWRPVSLASPLVSCCSTVSIVPLKRKERKKSYLSICFL